MLIPDLSKLRERLQNEIASLRAGTTSINQDKAVSNMDNATINSVMDEIIETRRLQLTLARLIKEKQIGCGNE